jgi:hypothetical protein
MEHIDHDEIGLKVNNTIIKKITGPSSYAILLPPIDSSLPIQILFGDIHHSTNNSCEDEKGVYSIYESDFLGLFDEIAKAYPVHFYTESAFGKFIEDIEAQEDGYLFSRLVRSTKDCYGKEARLSYEYEEKCPTTYMNWVHVDPRYFERSVEGFISNYFRLYFKRQLESEELEVGWYDTFRNNYSMIQDDELYTISTVGHAICLMILREIIDSVKKSPRILTIGELSVRAQKEIQRIRDRNKGQNEFDKVYRRESGIDTHYEKLIDSIISMYLDNINTDTSSMYRQFKNLSITKEKLYKFFRQNLDIELFCSLKDYIDELELVYIALSPTSNINEKQTRIKNLHKFKTCLSKLSLIITYFTSSLLDMYYVIRMLKTTPSYLSIGYFGNFHTQNIIKFLVSELDYKIISSCSNNTKLEYTEVSRCIEITNSIDLDFILDYYIGKSRMDSLQKHHIILLHEHAHRLESLKNSMFWWMGKQLKQAIEKPHFLV